MSQAVLNVVNTIRVSCMKIELDYTTLEERFRTRVLYARGEQLAEFQAELAEASSVAVKWQQLVDAADLVDAGLEDTKKQFSQTTKQQVQDFQEVLITFKERFQAEGPGLTTITLDQVRLAVAGGRVESFRACSRCETATSWAGLLSVARNALAI